MSTHDEGRFSTRDGVEIFWQRVRPEGRPRAVLAFVHGHMEHSGKYLHFGRAMARRGHAWYGLDRRGHGRSEGQRGHVDRFVQYLEEVEDFLKLMRNQESITPLFLTGHSVGGMIALMYGLQHPEGLAGVIACSPWLRESPSFHIPWWQRMLRPAAGLLSLLRPTFTMRGSIAGIPCTHDPEMVSRTASDPLAHDCTTVRYYLESRRAAQWTLGHAFQLSLPCLILQAEEDFLSDPAASREFYERVPHLDKRFVLYGCFYHEVLNELERERIFQEIHAWITAHLRGV